ncbi:pentapeptide repeat-containing protein [Leptolyngbya cf. ectocarpi LEGE 11479]|uniref:Pentapeptide repeat-containing protein n=1 Tax=Leptolyngbya cf. ectocarpi LEGE 11479 TaxID=1828722 RepID=A0A928X2I4_LEPEC|nr:pentapeptide repeat-containing protein [Leptolyngbya ectocarpi]MBE9065868.1 pentapeptide repeat-containing protein [Leptolyngbya cf. ectocarpi LEGE 11479]
MRGWTRVQGIVFFSALIALAVILVFAEPIATWLEKWAFIKILDAVSKLGVLIAVITFLVEIPKREERIQTERKRAHFEYWQVIDAAIAAGTSTSNARKMALENLAGEGVSLRNIDVPKAELRRINLAKADMVGANLREVDLTDAILDRADLSKASLYRARLYGASLLDAKLESTDLKEVLYDDRTRFPTGFRADRLGAYLIAPNVSLSGVQLPKAVLWGVNLQYASLQESNFSDAGFHGALLQNANFQGANLQGSRFRNANLEGASFKDANIQKANFGEAKGLTVEQIKTAQNWEKAIYSAEFSIALGLKA